MKEGYSRMKNIIKIIAVSVFFFFVVGCQPLEPLIFGVPQSQWYTLTQAQKNAVIRSYNRQQEINAQNAQYVVPIPVEPVETTIISTPSPMVIYDIEERDYYRIHHHHRHHRPAPPPPDPPHPYPYPFPPGPVPPHPFPPYPFPPGPIPPHPFPPQPHPTPGPTPWPWPPHPHHIPEPVPAPGPGPMPQPVPHPPAPTPPTPHPLPIPNDIKIPVTDSPPSKPFSM